jgi:hypothetical protein
MLTRKHATKRTSRITIKRDGRLLSITIEGAIALITIGVVSTIYLIHLVS